MPLSKFKKTLKKVGRRVRKFASKRYGANNPSAMTNMKNDIELVKALINTEKKRFQLINGGITQLLGQCYQASSSGHYLIEATPIPVVGVGYNQRTGASIKLYSSFYKFQFQHQNAAVAPIKIRIQLYLNKGNSVPTGTATGELTVTPLILAPNPWVKNSDNQNIYDYHSSRDMDKIGDWKLLMTKKLSLPPDQYSGQPMLKEFQFGVRMPKDSHVRFDKDTTNCTAGQLVVIITADCGNCSNATASTLTAVPFTAISTGVAFKYDITHYYIDN